MQPPILNLDDLEYTREIEHGERFRARIAPVGARIGARKLGYNVTVVPPGKTAFPFHDHHVNEEMFFVLEGTGTLRYGSEEHPLRAGDLVACPAGGPEVAHQILDTGEGDLRYLAVSTTAGNDVFQYPDSGKVGVVAGREPGMRAHEASFAGFYREDARLDDWDGE